MQISDFLLAQNIVFCEDDCTKKRALEILSLTLSNITGIDSAMILQQFIARERIGSTALGHGVALPHVRIAGLKKPAAVFLKLAKGVDFDSPDNIPVDLIFGLLVPENANEQHLQILSEIAQYFHSEKNRQRLRQATSTAAAFELFNQLIETALS